jgi:hypothetical protein
MLKSLTIAAALFTAAHAQADEATHTLTGDAARSLIDLLEDAGVEPVQQIEGRTWFASELSCSRGSIGGPRVFTSCSVTLAPEAEAQDVDAETADALVQLFVAQDLPFTQYIEGRGWSFANVVCSTQFMSGQVSVNCSLDYI